MAPGLFWACSMAAIATHSLLALRYAGFARNNFLLGKKALQGFRFLISCCYQVSDFVDYRVKHETGVASFAVIARVRADGCPLAPRQLVPLVDGVSAHYADAVAAQAPRLKSTGCRLVRRRGRPCIQTPLAFPLLRWRRLPGMAGASAPARKCPCLSHTEIWSFQ